MKKPSGERTLFMSVLLSAPGPLVVGLGLLVGKSATQLADFVRRTAELAALIVSLIVFRSLHREGAPDHQRKEKLERYATLGVGLAMCLGGAAMALLAFISKTDDKGNVIPGLLIALLGVVTNSWSGSATINSIRKAPAPSWRFRAACTVQKRWWICA